MTVGAYMSMAKRQKHLKTAGNHQIEYKYTPSGFVYGIAITAITAFGLCGYYIFSKSSLKLNKRARKKEKNIVE